MDTSTLSPLCVTIAATVRDAVIIISDHMTDVRASGLSEGLGRLLAVVNQVKPLLSHGPHAISSSTIGTIKPHLSMSSEILSTIRDYIQSRVSEMVGPSWDRGPVEECSRMLSTQSDFFDLLLELLSFGNQVDQDVKLETASAMKLLIEISKDAQQIRDGHSIITGTASTTSIPTIPMGPGNGTPSGKQAPGTPQQVLSVVPPHFSTEKIAIAQEEGDRFPELGPRPSNATTASLSSGKPLSSSPGRRIAFSRAFGILGLGRDHVNPKFLTSQLCQACRDGKYDWANSLLKEGTQINSPDARCRSPLSYAVSYGHLDIVKLLVDNGALVGGPEGKSSSIIFSAVGKGDMAVLAFLLEQSPPVSFPCWDPQDHHRRITPLLLAVDMGNYDAAQLLLEHGADAHETDSKGMNALCIAINRGHPSVVQLLVKYHARINGTESVASWGTGVAPLHVAAYQGHAEILRILLSLGADVAITCRQGDTKGITPLHLAANEECVDVLIKWGAKVHAIDSKHQHPLSTVIQLRALGSVKALLRHGSPINAQDYRRETALEMTCRLFVQDASAGGGGCDRLPAYCEIADELLIANANTGSRAKARGVVRAEYDRLLKVHKVPGALSGEMLPLRDLMRLIVGIVEAKAADEPVKPTRSAKTFFEGMISESVLAKLVTKELT